MKKTFLQLLLTFAVSPTFSQVVKVSIPEPVVVGVVKSVGLFVAELKYTIINGDTTYFIVYKNMDYPSISDIKKVSFTNVGGAVEELYNILAEAYDKDKGSKTSLMLGDTLVSILTERDMGVKILKVRFANGGHFRFESKKQIKKLFGKN